MVLPQTSLFFPSPKEQKQLLSMQRRRQVSPLLPFCVLPIVILCTVAVAGLAFVFLNLGRIDDQDDELKDLKQLILEINADINEQVDGIKANVSTLAQLDESIIGCVEEICADFPEGLKAVNLIGCWDANTNTPPIVSSTGNGNDAYIVCVGGGTTINGQDDWERGDWLVFIASEGVWIKNDGSPTLNFQGCWDADSNTPTIVSSTGDDGDLFVVCANGTTAIDGEDDWERGDWLVFVESEGVWIKNDGSPQEIVCPNITILENIPLKQTWTVTYSSNDNDLENLPQHEIALFGEVDNGDIFIEVSAKEVDWDDADPPNQPRFNMTGFPLDPAGLPTKIFWTELRTIGTFAITDPLPESILAFEAFFAPDIWELSVDSPTGLSTSHEFHFRVTYTPA